VKNLLPDCVQSTPWPNARFCDFYLREIALIVLPIDWAMCEVLWYDMGLLACPHDYPQPTHIFCGHRK
jgi:hypothetical protein